MWVIGTNLVLSVPESKRFTEFLSKVDTVVVQDAYVTETSGLADVYLLVLSWSERGDCHGRRHDGV